MYLANGWAWYVLTINIGESGQVAFSSLAKFELYVFHAHNSKRINAHSNLLSGIDCEQSLLTLFVPAVKNFIVTYGTLLIPINIWKIYNEIVEGLCLPAVADDFWPERIEVPNHVFENNMVVMDWTNINKEAEIELEQDKALHQNEN